MSHRGRYEQQHHTSCPQAGGQLHQALWPRGVPGSSLGSETHWSDSRMQAATQGLPLLWLPKV